MKTPLESRGEEK